MSIPGIGLSVGADLSAFHRDMDAAAKRLEEFGGSTATAKIGGSSAAAGGTSAGSAAQSFAPMASIASRLGQQIERLTSAMASGIGRLGNAAGNAARNPYSLGGGLKKGEDPGKKFGKITAGASLSGGQNLESRQGLKGFRSYINQKNAAQAAGGGGGMGGQASAASASAAASAKVAQNMGMVGRTTQAATSSMRGFGGQVAASLGLIGAGFSAVEGIKASITAASDLNEQINASQVMFGAASSSIVAESNRMAASFGIVKSEYLEGVTNLGSLGKAAGMAGPEAAEMGKKFTQLGLDLSSIRNVPVPEALAAIRSGLSGESEPLKKFGVLMNESTVKAQAAAMGLGKMGAALTESEKVQVRAAIIARDLSYANGDLANTAGGAANMMRAIGGRATNLAADFGMAIQPITDMALKGATSFLDWGTQIVQWGASSGGAISGFVSVIQNLPAHWAIAADQFSLKALQIVEWFKVIPDNLSIIAGWISNNWTKQIADDINSMGLTFVNLATNVKNAWSAVMSYLSGGDFDFKWTHLDEGFKRSAEQLPEFVKPAVTEAMKVLQQGIESKQGKLMDDMVKQAQAKTAAGLAAEKTPAEQVTDSAKASEGLKKGKDEKKFAGAVELGSKEARSSILAGRGVGDGKDGLKDLARTSKKSLDIQKEMALSLQAIAKNPPAANLAALPI